MTCPHCRLTLATEHTYLRHVASPHTSTCEVCWAMCKPSTGGTGLDITNHLRMFHPEVAPARGVLHHATLDERIAATVTQIERERDIPPRQRTTYRRRMALLKQLDERVARMSDDERAALAVAAWGNGRLRGEA